MVGLAWVMLAADDLILTNDSDKELARKVDQWKVSFKKR